MSRTIHVQLIVYDYNNRSIENFCFVYCARSPWARTELTVVERKRKRKRKPKLLP